MSDKFTKWKLLPALGLLFAALTPGASAGVFGDGDPANGTEDARLSLSVGGGSPPSSSWFRSVGTLVCDGKVRGTAVLVDHSRTAPDLEGVVIATAAHVLFDLEKRRRWASCDFAFMGLEELPGYRVPLSDKVLLGGFDPDANPSEPSRGSGDWAFAWLGDHWEPPSSWYGLQPAAWDGERLAEMTVGFVGWDQGNNQVSVVPACNAVMSSLENLGGGDWKGQALDNCDSDQGASGGGMVAVENNISWLVAIRGGTHWDSELWPLGEFPEGPPKGTPWDPDRFTNYARLLDESVLEDLQTWLNTL